METGKFRKNSTNFDIKEAINEIIIIYNDKAILNSISL